MSVALAGETVDELRRSAENLTESDLSLFTTGVVSARVPGADLMVLKPAGVSRDDLSADSLVITDLSGADAHAYVYREMPEVLGVVNTRSTISLAWAGRREPIPHVPTIANEFAGPIPVAPSTGDSLGRTIVDTLRATNSPAVLIPSHGPFTTGPTPATALKLALRLEHLTRTLHIARHLGTTTPLSPQDTAWLRATS